ncbi:hypothetical protein [Desulfobacterium sp. N47]|uniref:Uncharacterized protein n=1 Tax=uncultured Desulfobacterium sp. TaxID=201089 RepID=E1Y902_9BACT|nr:hypothetical protein N47_A10750 [uncultured Desulfobacterium sp.]
MPAWRINSHRQKEFTGGNDNWEMAAETAANCTFFVPDDEDEQIADDPISCYNCRKRRWTSESIVCMLLSG